MARKKLEVDVSESVAVSNKVVWECQLDILPAMQVEASNREEAIEAYFKMFGVISSEKETTCRRLGAI
jgi:hypothetical protein